MKKDNTTANIQTAVNCCFVVGVVFLVVITCIAAPEYPVSSSNEPSSTQQSEDDFRALLDEEGLELRGERSDNEYEAASIVIWTGLAVCLCILGGIVLCAIGDLIFGERAIGPHGLRGIGSRGLRAIGPRGQRWRQIAQELAAQEAADEPYRGGHVHRRRRRRALEATALEVDTAALDGVADNAVAQDDDEEPWLDIH